MSVNPYKNLPHDKGNVPMQEFPAPYLAKTRHTKENATVSSVVSVSHDTTSIEVAASGGFAVAIRWVPTSETAAVSPFASIITLAGATSNYDHVIAKDTVRRFAIPIEVMATNNSSMVGANRTNGLYQRVAFKSMGIASVLLSEF